MKEGWEYKKLGDVTTQISDGSHNPPKGIEFSNYPMLSSKNIFFDKYDYDSPRYLSKEDFETENKRTNISDGDVLLTIVGTVGRTCCVQAPFMPFTLQRSVAVLKPKKDKIGARFLMYFLHSLSDFWEIEAKGVAQKGVYLKQIGKIQISVPPLSEQQHIVEELDLLSSIIEKKKAQLNELDNLAQSLFYEMFGDPITNEKGWEYISLENLIKESIILYHLDGNHGGNYPRSEEFVDKGVPYIGANCIRDGEIDFSMAKYLTEEKVMTLRKGIAENNDVLFAHNATVGPVAILRTNEKKVILSTSLTAYRCNTTRIQPLFLKSYMDSSWFVSQYVSIMKQATRNQVPITSQRKMFFILPSIQLQNQFADKVQNIEHQKELIKKSIKEVETLFNSRMDYYFN